MAQTIAQLMVEVGADTSAAQKGLGTLDSTITGATARGVAGGKGIQDTFDTLTGAFASTISTAGDFEQAMSGIKAVMTPGDVQQFGGALSDLALTLGKDTVFTAREAAGGIEELIKAGIPAQAVLDGAAKSALALAAATGIPVADAATVAAQAMNAFQVPAEGLTHTVDFLAGAANASAADMTDLKFGLQAVGSVASTVGLSFDDTATALGLLANNGLRGQDAGTSLKTMLINLTPSTKKAANLMKELGIITEDGANQFFDATGKVKDLAGISDVLQKALAGQTEQQKLANLQQLFGTDSLRAAAILTKEGADGVHALTGEISKITAAQSAATRLDNFNGSVQQLQGSLETLAITMGERLLPFMRTLADTATNLVNGFLGLPEPVQTAIAAVAAIVGVVLIAATGFAIFSGVVAGLLPVIGAVGALIGALLGPVGLVIAAIALLTVAWVNNWGDIQGKTAVAVGFVMGVVGQLADFFTTTVLPALGTVAGFIRDNVLPFFIALADLGIAKLQAAVANLVTFWNTAFLPALQAVGDIFNQFILPPLQKLGDLIAQVISPVLDALGSILGPVGDQLRTLFAGVGANAPANLQAATAAIHAEAAATRTGAPATTFNAPLFGTVNVNSQVDADQLLNRVADVFDNAQNRVVPPQPAFSAGGFGGPF